VLRLGKRVAQYGRGATVDQLVGAMTGALELLAVAEVAHEEGVQP
jgi:hypothetical protein